MPQFRKMSHRNAVDPRFAKLLGQPKELKGGLVMNSLASPNDGNQQEASQQLKQRMQLGF